MKKEEWELLGERGFQKNYRIVKALKE